MTNKPNSNADLIATLESMAVGASCFDLLTPKSPSEGASIIERNRAAITTVQEIIQELDAKDACLTMIHVELQYHAPWPESDDMDPADKIMFGLGLLVQGRDALRAERDALRAALIEVRDNAKDDSPDMRGRVELALDFATTAKARKAFDDAVVEMARPGGKP